MKKYITMIVASVMMVSCVDTLILPNDKTVEEDFWKSKSDVQLMVNGAYQSMLGSDLISRLLVWGELRSEEVVPVASLTGSVQEDLNEINLGNTQVDNVYSEWSNLYATINRCNLVLDKAEAVMKEDPSYTQGDYLADCAQMLALRSLCYFYLVRNFRDVPYITKAFTIGSQNRNVPQTDPDSVLTACLKDLAVAEQNAILPTAYSQTDWRRVGYMTRDAINALQADIYLWLASVRHTANDYEQAIAYCDKVIESKKNQHVKGRGEVEEKEYWLAEGRRAYSEIFIDKNAEESIFELQFEDGRNSNVGLTTAYNHTSTSISSPPYLYASSIFLAGATGGVVFKSTNTTTGATDWRGLMSTYNTSISVGDFDGLEIRKYVSSKSNYNPTTTAVTYKDNKGSDESYTSTLSMNFIVYRLSDIMLLKAEALTALADTIYAPSQELRDSLLQDAFNLVREVNLRSRESKDDALLWTTFSTATDVYTAIEDLVLAERRRELCFEGKRWYDLLRYSYRHMTGVDYKTTLADQDKRGVPAASTYTNMLELVKLKLAGKGNAVAAKMNTEPRLYMPIPMSDLNICPALRQTPGYSANENYQKN